MYTPRPEPRGRGCGGHGDARNSSRSCATIVAERRKTPRDDLITPSDRRGGGRRQALGGRADRRHDPAPQRRPRGDGAFDRQCGEGDSGIGMNRLRRFSRAMNQLRPSCEEALRFDPPLHFFDRYALEPVEVDGVRLRKGEKIGLLLAAANRDPSRWPRRRPLRSGAPAASATSPSAPASISASARRSRGWRCRWRCRSSSSGCRSCASRRRRATATPGIFTGWRRSRWRGERRSAPQCPRGCRAKRASAAPVFSFCS